jgi:hypothetical protein
MGPTKEGLLVGGIGDITSVSCPLLEAEQDIFSPRATGAQFLLHSPRDYYCAPPIGHPRGDL